VPAFLPDAWFCKPRLDEKGAPTTSFSRGLKNHVFRTVRGQRFCLSPARVDDTFTCRNALPSGRAAKQSARK
jgi:hypothetical protein